MPRVRPSAATGTTVSTTSIFVTRTVPISRMVAIARRTVPPLTRHTTIPRSDPDRNLAGAVRVQ
eukprot:9480505-Pyramimonas_sp.AAC.1